MVVLAMAFRIWLSGRSVAPVARETPAAPAFMTSSSTIRPPGPEPVTEERSIPRSAAMALARGDALIRSFSSPKLDGGPGAEEADLEAASILDSGIRTRPAAGAMESAK